LQRESVFCAESRVFMT